jgi:hypothetical protein
MPLVGFRPTKARLIIEDNKASVLVMKVVVYPGDSVKLATGDRLEELTGVLRIRSKDDGAGNGARDLGSLVYIAESDLSADRSPAKYQINIAIASAKFDTLVRVALSGRLPTKFFVNAGERISRAELPGLGYEVRAGKRTKSWNTLAHRTLLVTNFSFILPIDVPEPRGDETATPETHPGPSVVTKAQVAELIDDVLVFHGETKHTLFAIMCILGVLAIAALVIGLLLFPRA